MPLLPILSDCPRPAPPAPFILAPWLTALPAGHRDLLSLLPVVDINGTVLSALHVHPLAEEEERTTAVAALFLADPFLRVRDAARSLAGAGVGAVANFPTVQLLDGETARVFDSADAGARREVEMLAAFREAGLGVYAFACDLKIARQMLAVGVSALVLHPAAPLSDWRHRAAAALAVSRTIAALRQETAIPLYVYRPKGFGAELDQASAAADGEARIVE